MYVDTSPTNIFSFESNSSTKKDTLVTTKNTRLVHLFVVHKYVNNTQNISIIEWFRFLIDHNPHPFENKFMFLFHTFAALISGNTWAQDIRMHKPIYFD